MIERTMEVGTEEPYLAGGEDEEDSDPGEGRRGGSRSSGGPPLESLLESVASSAGSWHRDLFLPPAAPTSGAAVGLCGR